MGDAPLDTILLLLGISLGATVWALLPRVQVTELRGRWPSTMGGRSPDHIRVHIHGGRKFRQPLSPSGRFTVRLPTGCTATIEFLAMADIRRRLLVEHRSRAGRENRHQYRSIELGDIPLMTVHSGTTRITILSDRSLTVTEEPGAAPHVPADRRLLNPVAGDHRDRCNG